ncbi:MAG: DUF1972 domain-containing protein [Actinomycetota bacterium]|nr:DUF1972 domain-containing protein [Actinomycetota bacterium]
MARRRPDPNSLSIALVGTRGVPARYGGFETAVQQVGQRLVEHGHRVVVYCRPTDDGSKPDSYLGMRLVHLPIVRKRPVETLVHTGLSVAHLVCHPTDVVIMFNAANAPWLPMIRGRRLPVATHVDGLEWQRAKWGAAGRLYYQVAEKLAVRWSDALIADAQGIADYYQQTHRATTTLISYGAPILPRAVRRLGELGLSDKGFHLVVARFEPENHVAELVEGYVRSCAQLPLVVVGSAPYSDEYTRRIRDRADGRVRLLGGVWDQQLLDQLYVGALTYLHGHSVGGTNPSLLRAIGAGTAVTAWDVVFNREVLGDAGRYVATPEAVAVEVEATEADLATTQQRATQSLRRASSYDWDDVANRYEALARRLVERS